MTHFVTCSRHPPQHVQQDKDDHGIDTTSHPTISAVTPSNDRRLGFHKQNYDCRWVVHLPLSRPRAHHLRVLGGRSERGHWNICYICLCIGRLSCLLRIGSVAMRRAGGRRCERQPKDIARTDFAQSKHTRGRVSLDVDRRPIVSLRHVASAQLWSLRRQYRRFGGSITWAGPTRWGPTRRDSPSIPPSFRQAAMVSMSSIA